ncbi:calcium-binding protein CML protein [Dioscorea alata]|uniref:Calcium-binding protein CML protein n=1 Tax=Dioscorea alata TaxID=55571 RepID=A0ACB7WBB9_DIOAL|nr:calcium-binding protein CML protein [Dioscorea alata]
MATILLRISILLHLLHSLLYSLPKKIKSCLKTSEITAKQDDDDVLITGTRPMLDLLELRRVFQTFDHDGDGRITKEELQDSLENLGIFISEGDLSAMIGRIDVNGDGCVDIDEFGALYGTIVGEMGREEVDEDVKEAFDVFDVNGDGYISVDELRFVLSSLGLRQGQTTDDFRRMIGKVDQDGDGRVSFNEFKDMMKGGGFVCLT